MVVRRSVALLVPLLFAMTAIAGCLGGETTSQESPTDDDGTDPGGGGGGDPDPGQGEGGVKGLVIDDGFLPIHGANVQLRQDGQGVAHTSTGETGKFEFTDIPTGSYRLQATAGCCKDNTERITIKAGETIQRDLRLERRSDEELQKPFVVPYEWDGFLGCGVSLLGAVQEAPCTADDNHDPTYRWNVTQGLRTLYVYMEWEPQSTGEELAMEVTAGGEYLYKEAEGATALHLRIDNDEIEEDALRFENIEGQLELFLDILPGGDLGVVFQQDFHVFILEFHWRTAPEDFEFTPPE